MTLTEAIHLIDGKHLSSTKKQTWADLGCGDGLFSKALSPILSADSTIYAIDQKAFSFSDPKIKFQKLNFEKDELLLPALDGIMMINSLHFIKDKLPLLRRLKEKLSPVGGFLLGEYDLTKANPWVPYPITFTKSVELFNSIGFNGVEKIGERQSSFNRAVIYSVFFYKK